MSPVLAYNHNIVYVYCIHYVVIGVQKLLRKKSIFSTGKGLSEVSTVLNRLVQLPSSWPLIPNEARFLLGLDRGLYGFFASF